MIRIGHATYRYGISQKKKWRYVIEPAKEVPPCWYGIPSHTVPLPAFQPCTYLNARQWWFVVGYSRNWTGDGGELWATAAEGGFLLLLMTLCFCILRFSIPIGYRVNNHHNSKILISRLIPSIRLSMKSRCASANASTLRRTPEIRAIDLASNSVTEPVAINALNIAKWFPEATRYQTSLKVEITATFMYCFFVTNNKQTYEIYDALLLDLLLAKIITVLNHKLMNHCYDHQAKPIFILQYTRWAKNYGLFYRSLQLP